MWCPGNNLGVMSEPISELISEMISETMSEQMSASMSESMSGMISETMSELMSESMSESMSEMMSEMMHDDFAQSARFPLCAYHEGILLNPRDACAYSAKFPHGAGWDRANRYHRKPPFAITVTHHSPTTTTTTTVFCYNLKSKT